ncbi:prepilin-like protein [Thermus thermophilus]|uniref:type IV pilus modification PilV family protein n=1 Tax=Thermus thermophilus TaxID=274 RepID=UPI00090A7693|nr:prepilin [Thermus thermophilus]BAW02796.1 prepilin-like protein [Thermus thermophilus]
MGLLAVVVLAFTSLQVASLRAGQRGRELQTVVREMENFMERLRQDPQGVPALCNGALTLGGRQGTCTAVPCGVAQDGGLTCPTSGDARAFQVVLEVEGKRLETVVYRP